MSKTAALVKDKQHNSLSPDWVLQGPSSQMVGCYNSVFFRIPSEVKSQRESNVQTKCTQIHTLSASYGHISPNITKSCLALWEADPLICIYLFITVFQMPLLCTSCLLHISHYRPHHHGASLEMFMAEHIREKVKAVSEMLQSSQAFSHMQSWSLFP